MNRAEERAFNEVALNESRKYYPISQKMSDEEKEMYAAKQVAFQVGFKAGVKWNEEELTDFENAMLHVGNSFFGKDAGLDVSDTKVVKEQAKLLSELVPKLEWSKKDEDFINMLILHFNYLIYKGGDSVETYKSYREKLKSLRPSWKPSEEQMTCLCAAVDAAIRKHNESVSGYKHARVLKSLYEQLNKLM